MQTTTMNPQSIMHQVNGDDDILEIEEEEKQYEMPRNPQSIIEPVQNTKVFAFQQKQPCVLLEKGRHNTQFRNMMAGYNPDELDDKEID